MPTQLQLRRGTTTEHSTFSGAVGEVTVDTTKDTLVVHDGATNGGFPLAKEAGATFGNTNVTGDFSFADNAKAIFGAGSDLQIYHDGSNSYINEQGTGNLYMRASNGLYIQNAAGTANGAQFIDNGAVYLFHAGQVKFETTATGVDVTGTAVTDGLTVAGNVSVDGGTIKLDGNYPVGTNNVALGDTALDSLVSGSNNVAIGHIALTANVSGSGNTAIGGFALAFNSDGSSNTALGNSALYDNVSGNFNVAIGESALENNTASTNTAVGYQSFYTNVSGTRNTSLGFTAGKNSTGNYNVYIGSYAGDNATGNSNIGIGDVALRNSVGGSNVAIGNDAMGVNVSGTINTATGFLALYQNSSGSGNSAYGANSLDANSTGIYNNAFGAYALTTNQGGSYNCAFGYGALNTNLNSDGSTAVGHQSLHNTTNTRNTAIGYRAGFDNSTGYGNVFVGHSAGLVTQTSNLNTIVGDFAGSSTTSAQNTFIGQGAGTSITSGAKNTVIGRYSGNEGGLDIRTSNNNIVLSDGDGNPRARWESNGKLALGYSMSQDNGHAVVVHGQAGEGALKINGGSTNGYWAMTVANPSTNTYGIHFLSNNVGVGNIRINASSTSYNTSSDYRLKENVVDLTGAADRVQQLTPKRFSFIADADKTVDGFLAHEVADIVPEAISGEKDAVDADGNPVYQGIDQSKLVPLLTAALQEALTKIDQLETRIEALET